MKTELHRADIESPLLAVDGLKKHFPLRRHLFSRAIGKVYAVDGVSFRIEKGETLGLVGESGCGKSTICRLILRLIEPTEGRITFSNKNIFSSDKEELRGLRRDLGFIFQDPYASLNPRMKVADIVGEPLQIHQITKSRRETKERVVSILERVGLQSEHLRRYPHEFSGGQRQRIGIARALSLHPRLVICDEPVSALDVSIQAQVLNLLVELQKEFDLTYLFIAHDLRVVEYISNRIAVMYLGKIVESAGARELSNHPRHPYTEALLSAVPMPDPKANKRRIILEGDVPSPVSPPTGCSFHPRCPYRKKDCAEISPNFFEISPGHYVSCHHPIN